MRQIAIPAVWMRGGTSKGLFLHARDLPRDSARRDRLLLRAIGSPDPYGRQIDGLGGATSSTSKVVIIQPSLRDDCDIDYLFGHVSIQRPHIDWSGNCGNLSAAVGPFAIDEGLLAAADPQTAVRIWQANTEKRFIAEIATPGGLVAVDGECRIAGVAGSGAPIRLRYLRPAGGSGLDLLPSGRVRELLRLEDGSDIEASLVNAGNPTVFVAAASLGLDGTEQADRIDADAALLRRLEMVRVAGAMRMGLGDDAATISRDRPATPKVAWVAPAVAYHTTHGESVAATQIDVLARIISFGRLHHAITGTGAIALAVAAHLQGSIPWQAIGAPGNGSLRIGHNAGVMAVEAGIRRTADTWTVDDVSLFRTARRMMQGEVLVPA